MIDKIRKIFRQPLQLSNLTPDENRRIVSKALKALNCTGEWQEEKDAATVRFDFQSGHFGISISSRHPQVELSFLFFAEADMNDINIVRQVCNQSNLNSDGPRFTYTVNEKTNVIDLHILTMLLLDEDRAKDILSSAMVDAFAWQNSFIRHLGEVKREAGNAGTNDLEKAVKDFSRSIFLLHEQELSHQQTAPGWRHNDKEPATLEQWMDRAFGRVDVIFSELTVVADGITVISDREAIAAYNLSDALIAGGAFVRPKAMLDLMFFLPSHPATRRRMTFSLQQADSCADILYYQVAATLLPLQAASDRPLHTKEMQVESHSALLAYDLRSTKQLQDEFVYMWKEAKIKIVSGEARQLTEEQQLIANVVNMDAGGFVYRGKVLYQQKRYYEATASLENAFRLLYSGFLKLNREERNIFFEVCFMLGFCYNELRQYERAFYYLTFTLDLRRAGYAEAYVNCLINMGDFRSLRSIDGFLDELRNAVSDGDEEELESRFRLLLRFLYRRKTYVLIEMRRLDEAEKILLRMADDPDNADFARDELAYIRHLRRTGTDRKNIP